MAKFFPMKSQTENILQPDAGFMEFDLDSDIGYQEWRGMFAEMGVKGCLFNAYMVQTDGATVRLSTTPVQLNLFSHAMYVAPPFEQREFYMELPRSLARLGKVYFKLPEGVDPRALEGFKPERRDMYAIDLWLTGEDGRTQTIYTFIYEATVKTEEAEYHVMRFESEQLNQENGYPLQ